jgi:heme-degrading monooxygenase HmoA
MEEPRMDRPLPDAAVSARALESLLGLLWPKGRQARTAELTPIPTQSPLTQVGSPVSVFSTTASRSETLYVIVWEFLARRGEERRFEDEFGSAGDWVELFRQAPGYLGTQLCRDAQNTRRYATVDYWTSADAYRAFRVRWRDAFEAIDERCRALTDREVCVGTFLLLPGVSLPLAT